jgi:maltooligosyltrehalose trehalohydrolase
MAPAAPRVELNLLTGSAAGTHVMQPSRDEGVWELLVEQAAPGDRYNYRIAEQGPFPDPASRFQPEGVHGPSEVIDPRRYQWHDDQWPGREPHDYIVYELHVGTFTREGTFASTRAHLPHLAQLGVTAIEIMPIADFAGSRNWGYDGVSLFAPARAYGHPDDFRALVDDAHRLGMAVVLDVVYNHLGPEGAYLTQFNKGYITDRHETPWGGAINVDGDGSDAIRKFIVDNATHWVREYHVDGLRLDATHALIDDSSTHIVAELTRYARAAARWPVTVHAEDHRNLSVLLEESQRGGWQLDGVWADDFHHVVRRLLAGDTHGYYQDFKGTTEELARVLRQGWLYTGQRSKHMDEPRGTDPSAIPMYKFVVCLQNHDQIGNRACGDRLHHAIDAAAWRAATTLLLTAPMTPLLFMGQEWAASAPFQYFTDLEPELGKAVTEGRRKEFRDFPEFSDPAAREKIPDPQAVSTFEASKLDWAERGEPARSAVLALYRELLKLRRKEPALCASTELTADARPAGADAILLRRGPFVIAVQLRGAGDVDLGDIAATGALNLVLTTEDPQFATDPQPPVIAGGLITFHRPGAVIARLREER